MRLLVMAIVGLLMAFGWAQIEGPAGPYRVTLSTQPQVIPVGQAKLVIKVRDQAGATAEDVTVRALARMPGMSMGEREQPGIKAPGETGTYLVPAAFPMGGAYEIVVKVKGKLGDGSVTLSARTGQDTGSAKSQAQWLAYLPWLFAVALILIVLVRMRKTGQQLSLSGILNVKTILGLLFLAVMFVASIYAINHWRRPGSMTPIEAQIMEMNMPAPPGVTAVTLATVEEGPISEVLKYTGQAVGFIEQDVNVRVPGVIVTMPVYVGDKVKSGQLLARLDTSQLAPQLAERAAMLNMAGQDVGVAASEYEAALQEVIEAKADVSVREAAVAEEEAMLEAAKQEKSALESDVDLAEAGVDNAHAEVAAARETSKFREAERDRKKGLFEAGAVSRAEFQRAESEAAEAVAKLHHAESLVREAEARVRAANAGVRKSESMISAADRRLSQAKAQLRAANATVVSRQRTAEAAKKNIAREQAAVAQAKAGYQGAATQQGYASIKSEVDGVVTERAISPGTLVNPGQTILKIAQISPIRLQANVPLSDLSRIHIGDRVTVYQGGSSISASVTSIAPSLDPLARTGVVEALWPNKSFAFLPGQFVEMRIAVGAATKALTVPADAVQYPPGPAKPFVWVAEATDSGRFTVHRMEVKPTVGDGDRIAITGKLKKGQFVVAKGAAYLRDGGEVTASVAHAAAKGPVIEVLATGYKPETITVQHGKPVTLTFIRRTDQSCGEEVMFPDLGIRKKLPINEPVEITFTPDNSGELKFTCGMEMLTGTVIVR